MGIRLLANHSLACEHRRAVTGSAEPEIRLLSQAISKYWDFKRHFSLATYAKILGLVPYAQAMAQFILKIEKLSHIIGAAPILRYSARLRSPSPIMAPGKL